MREATFKVSTRPDGTLIGECDVLRLAVSAMDRVDLQEEARDALIRGVGPAHVSYRIRLIQNGTSPNNAPLPRIRSLVLPQKQ